LTLEDIRNAISNTRLNGAEGFLSGAQHAYTISANDQLTSGERCKKHHRRLLQWIGRLISGIAQVTNRVENSRLTEIGS
jgi:multidrug efflux pump